MNPLFRLFSPGQALRNSFGPRALGLALMAATGSSLAAPVMNYDIRADDWYSAYLLDVTTPQAPNTLGVNFDSQGDAFIRDSGSVALTPGRHYVLQVFVQDVASVISAWAGKFVLDPGFQFACNGSNTLYTNTNPGCWQASATALANTNPYPALAVFQPNAPLTAATEAYADPTDTPSLLGNYGVGPWGILGANDPLASSPAQWIWESSNSPLPGVTPGVGTVHAWFTTRVEAVPEPSSAWLIAAGLMAAAAASRKRGGTRQTSPLVVE